jgi:hypothetical protein
MECLFLNAFIWLAMGKWIDMLRVFISYSIVCFKLYKIKSQYARFIQQQAHTLLLIIIAISISIQHIQRTFTFNSIDNILILSYLGSNLTFSMIEGMKRSFTLCEAFTISNVLMYATSHSIFYPANDEQLITYLPVNCSTDHIYYLLRIGI